MSLARAFTKRVKRQNELTSTPSESPSRYLAGKIERSKISLPTEFLSTTNMHALSCPDIRNVSSASSEFSQRSADDSDASRSFHSTPATSPATSSSEPSPLIPEPSQRKPFFGPSQPSTTSALRLSSSTSSSHNSDAAPALPHRAASHSKKAHQELGRRRSACRLTLPPTSLFTPPIIRNSAEIFGGSSNVDSKHPFSHELAQVHEVAEEFGGSSCLLEEEEEMRTKGLYKFDADDYVCEILGLFSGRLGGHLTGLASPWI